MAHLALSLLGSFQATLDREPVVAFESDKVRALLAFLAVESGRPHSRGKLAGLLWPDSAETASHASLSQALSNLRHALGDRNLELPVLLISRQAIQFNCESDAFVDAVALEKLSGARDRSPSCLAALEQAASLYRGRFLEGFSLPGCSEFEEWLLLEQEHLHRLAREALERLAQAYEGQGELERALAFAWRQLELDPWWESAHRQAIRLLACSGQRQAALSQYQTCCRLLAEGLAAEPAPETVRLYEQIRAGRLPAAALPKEHAPVVTPVALPGFLTGRAPAARRPVFVARERELAWLDARLASAMQGRGQAAFVVGGPGRGKTLLIHEFARRALDAHPDLLLAMGACNAYLGVGDPYLPFRGVLAMLTGDVEPAWAAGTMSAAQARRMWDALPDVAPVLARRGTGLIGTLLPGRELLLRARAAAADGTEWLPALCRLADPLMNPPGGLEQSHLFEQYSNVLVELSAVHPLLLILDDLHWADHASAGLLFHLGRRIERGRILLAGAYRPHELAVLRDGERHVLEPALAEFRARFDDAWLDLAAACEAEGRLFVDRVLDVEPNVLDGRFRETLFRRTRGHPLFTVELLRAMQERGDLVHDPAGSWSEGDKLDWESIPPRVGAAIAERVDRLPEVLRQVLSVASVEGESFTAQAVALVLGMDELHTLRLLREQLAARHRLVLEQGERNAGGRALSNYRFAHFLFQQHLYQGLGEGERRLLHHRVGEVLEQLYTGRLEEVAVQLVRHFAGDPQRELRYARLAGERAAAQCANEDALRHLSRALELTEAGECTQRYELLLVRERVYHLVGRRDAQLKDLLELEALAERLGPEQQAAVALRRAVHAIHGGNYRAAIIAAQTAVERAHASAEAAVQAWGHLRWGQALHRQGENSAAQSHFAQALTLARACGLRVVEAQALSWLAECALDPVQVQKRYWQDALRVAREAGDRWSEGDILAGKSVFDLGSGDLAGARTDLEQHVRYNRQIGYRRDEGYALDCLARYYEAVGDYAQVRSCCDEALRVASEVEDPYLMACVLGYRAGASLVLGDPVGALQDAEQSLRVACEAENLECQGWAHLGLGNLYQWLDDSATAHRHYAQALSLLRQLGGPGRAMGALAGLAWAEMNLGRLTEAQDRVAEILIQLDSGYRPHAADKPFLVYLTCCRVLNAAGDLRGVAFLAWAHSLLQEWAGSAPDDATRRSFLENVPWNRELLREWQCSHRKPD